MWVFSYLVFPNLLGTNSYFRAIFALQDGAWYRNFVHKLRMITDELYPWGKTRHDCKLSIHNGAQAGVS